MNEVKKTNKEINKLREAFRLEYTRFKENFNEISQRMYLLCSQADELLDFMDRLNKIEMESEKGI